MHYAQTNPTACGTDLQCVHLVVHISACHAELTSAAYSFTGGPVNYWGSKLLGSYALCIAVYTPCSSISNTVLTQRTSIGRSAGL